MAVFSVGDQRKKTLNKQFDLFPSQCSNHRDNDATKENELRTNNLYFHAPRGCDAESDIEVLCEKQVAKDSKEHDEAKKNSLLDHIDWFVMSR